MSKTITLRLSDGEYERISSCAKIEHRPISNFITHSVLNGIQDSYYVDSIEMAQIEGDEKLLKKLKSGHKDVQGRKGRFVE